MRLKSKTTATILIALFMISTLAFANAAESIVVFGGNKSYLVGYSSGNGYDGGDCVHLQTTTATLGDGSEARVAIKMPEGTVLDDIELISWMQYIVAGPSVHVDIMVDTTDNGEIDDALVVQYAYNDYGTGKHYPDNPWYYGVVKGSWEATFSDDGDGPAVIDDDAMAWAATGASGAPPTTTGFFFYSLAEWKIGKEYGSKTIDGDTSVLELQFEVDSWVPAVPTIGDPGVNANAFIDDIRINDDTYQLEEPIDLETGLSATVEALTMSFTVSPDDVIFPATKPGITVPGNVPLVITNTGDYDITFTAELINEVPEDFYTTNLLVDGSSVGSWSASVLGVDEDDFITVPLSLDIPYPCPAGAKVATLVFWAEATGYTP